ncbi:hypothetical protein CONLIGDRAFT_597232 [Coniochaeta ligniaria NRRL 30616]|uniref:Aminoglycoside phosphotransferase domain-containing protein n=1 Tax=Coniochaeta ligniaria NRRL 30616 TaxID=1408157 RepID=A0A1J7ISN1_9PEZI|nr:hypothetical protein CONLIGDRAFT_597232 [Coniochaeta ligniaria NRRL 30616]
MSRPTKEEEQAEVDSVIAAIGEARGRILRYPSEYLLYYFVKNAKKPVEAARYVERRMEASESYLMVSDWAYIIECTVTDKGTLPEPLAKRQKETIKERDRGKCCITGSKGTLCDPLIVAPVLKVPRGWRAGLDKGKKKEEDRISSMLFAFFGRPFASWLLIWAMGSETASKMGLSSVGGPNSHWLVRKSVAKAFARGTIMLESTRVKGEVFYRIRNQLLGTERRLDRLSRFVLGGRTNFGQVHWRFLETHARLSMSMRYIEIAKDIAPEILQEGGVSKLSFGLVDVAPELPLPLFEGEPRRLPVLMRSFLTKALLAPWLVLPAKFRSIVYEKMRFLGKKLDTHYHHRGCNWQSLPVGLRLQFHTADYSIHFYENEFNTLRLIRQHTTIPVAQPLDFVAGPEAEKANGWTNGPSKQLSLITNLPGSSLDLCIDFMSMEHINEIAAQLRHYISQLRRIPQTVNPDMAICNSLGKSLVNPRLQNPNRGPFRDEREFSQTLMFPDDPSRRGHKVVFTHGGLNSRSILVDRYVRSDGTTGWKITGIVNWRSAGWYPEYWEYTNSLYMRKKLGARHRDLMRIVFREFGDYEEELKIEKQCWDLDGKENTQKIQKLNEECFVQNKKLMKEYRKEVMQEYLESIKKKQVNEDEDEDEDDQKEVKEKDLEKHAGDGESDDESLGLHVVIGPY